MMTDNIDAPSVNFLVNIITNYGFPVFTSICVIYGLYYLWRWVTFEITPLLAEINTHLSSVVGRIKTLEHDVEKLNQKVTIITILRSQSGEPVNGVPQTHHERP